MSTVFSSYSRRPVYDTSHSIATYGKWDPYALVNGPPWEEMPMRLQFVIQGILCIEYTNYIMHRTRLRIVFCYIV